MIRNIISKFRLDRQKTQLSFTLHSRHSAVKLMPKPKFKKPEANSTVAAECLTGFMTNYGI